MPELLLELLSEEIPARMQARAAEDLKRLVCEGLEREQLAFDHAEAYVTPRRLALVVYGLPERQGTIQRARRGPRVDASETAISGFFTATGISDSGKYIQTAKGLTPGGEPLHLETPGSPVSYLISIQNTPKGNYFIISGEEPGKDTSDVLAQLILPIILEFPWPKSMRWGGGAFRWVRPLQSIIAMLDGAPIPFTLPLGENGSLAAGTTTRGHRFLAPTEFVVRDFADYRDRLRAAKVMLDPAERRPLIAERAAALAAAEGLLVREDEALLDEVTGLLEWPVPMLGSINPKFMDVPAEVLVTAMRAHQKYFSLLDADGRLAPRFVLVANTEATDGGKAIVAGNERVLRARLSDAKFFWDEDRKRSLESRVSKLAERVFHAKLGNDLQRVERLENLAREIARAMRTPHLARDASVAQALQAISLSLSQVEEFADRCVRAARLCKADLTTAMVGEFPELQGIMGRYYAENDEEPSEVADAIAEHYSPQGPSDRCPAAPVSVAVALADKIDTLIGFFRIGERPSGSKDPFALRRAAIGVIRLIVENRLRVPLKRIFEQAAIQYESYQYIQFSRRDTAISTHDWQLLFEELLAFLADRLKVHLREQGVRHDLIAAVFAAGGAEGAEDDIVRLLARVDALRAFLDTEDGANLLVAYRRASNIVRIEENKDNRRYEGEAEEALLAESQEIELHRALSAARAGVGRALDGEQFGEAMTILAALRAPVDAFFEHVKVNCADADLRINRLKLLSQIRSALGGVADFSQIEG